MSTKANVHYSSYVHLSNWKRQDRCKRKIFIERSPDFQSNIEWSTVSMGSTPVNVYQPTHALMSDRFAVYVTAELSAPVVSLRS